MCESKINGFLPETQEQIPLSSSLITCPSVHFMTIFHVACLPSFKSWTEMNLITGRDTEFRTFCLVYLGSGVLLRLRFIKCVFLGVLPVLAAKSEGSEFGVPQTRRAMYGTHM